MGYFEGLKKVAKDNLIPWERKLPGAPTVVVDFI
jgi:hypothetical protein